MYPGASDKMNCSKVIHQLGVCYFAVASVEEDERSQGARWRGTAHCRQIPDKRRLQNVVNLFNIEETVW
jgi:hypothetical protein